MFTGKYVPNHGNKLNETMVLAEILKEYGYATAAFTDGGIMSSSFGFDKGFDMFDGEPDNSYDNKDKLSRYDRWLNDNKNGKFFIFLHFYDIHAPYQPPEPYLTEYTGYYKDKKFIEYLTDDTHPDVKYNTNKDGTRQKILENAQLVSDIYTAQIPAFDALTFKRIISELKTAGVYNNTIIIVTSDHGEFFGETGLFGHGPLDFPGLRVPLIIHLPTEIHKKIQYPVSGVDITPTILDMLDIPISEKLDGISLKNLTVDGKMPEERIRLAHELKGYPTFCQEGENAVIVRTENKTITGTNVVMSLRGKENKGIGKSRKRCNETVEKLIMNAGDVDLKRNTELDDETKNELRRLGYIE
jgi:arylsulfatase